MKLVLAYLLTFFLAPTMGALASLITLPLIPAMKSNLALGVLCLAAGVGDTILAVWFGVKLFFWLDQTPTLVMVIVLGSGYALNGLNRILRRQTPYEFGWLIGNLSGLVIGASILLPQIPGR